MTIRRLGFAPLVLSLIAVACGNNPPPTSAPTESTVESASSGAVPSEAEATTPAPSESRVEPAEPVVLWEQFVGDFNQKDPARLARWSPEQGVLLLDNPGAFVRVKLMESAPALRTQEGGYDGARIKNITLSKQIDAGPIPTTDCGEQQELSPGVFQQASDGARIKTMIEAMQEYELAPKEEVDRLRAAFAKSAGLSLFLVADTKEHVSFLFGVSEDNVVLLAVDAVVPCSA